MIPALPVVLLCGQGASLTRTRIFMRMCHQDLHRATEWATSDPLIPLLTFILLSLPISSRRA